MALLFTDMEGSTRLLHELGDDYGELLATHDRLLREAWKQHDGVEVNTEGDAFFVAFGAVAEAVAAARSAQRALLAHPWKNGRAASVRMGLHLGVPQIYGRDYWGVDVNYAARLCAAASGGQVLVSESVAAAVDADTADLDDLGLHSLKDFPSPRRIFHLRIDGRGSDAFPPPRTLRAGRTNLPDQISTLVGRLEEVGDVAALLDAHRLVTLAGPGGVGKTRLAMETGARLLDGTGDGVWVAELAGTADATWLPFVVAAALGVHLQAEGDSVAQLAGHVGDSRLLLVLDNCEHLIEAAAHLTEALLRRCPGLTVLATSREPLGLPGEAVYRVPSLSVPAEDADEPEAALRHDGVRLFVERASAHRSDFALDRRTVGDVIAVVRRLDGIPLAIELAAPWLARLSVAELRARLERGFTLLAGGHRTAVDRQRTITALIAWSYEGMSPEEQRLLAELSVFAGGFDLAAAEAVCAATFGDGVVILLGGLVDKSLVQVEDVTGDLRYRLLETVRSYAAEKLQAMGDEAADRVRAAHLDHYMNVALDFVAERDRTRIPRRLTLLGRDRDNLRAAVARALADPDPEVALRLTAALTRFWIEDAHATEALVALDAALDRSDAPTADRGIALMTRSSLFAYDGAAAVAARLADADEAIAIAEQIGDDTIALRAHHYRAWLLMRTGDLAAALAAAERGIALVTDETSLEAVCRLFRAKAAVQMNAGADPRPALSRALDAARQCGEVVEANRVQAQLGWVLLTRGETKEARAAMTEAMNVARDLGMEVDALSTGCNLGYAIFLDGDAEEALRHEVEVLEAFDRHGGEEFRYYALVCIALAHSALGDDRVATALHGAVESHMAAIGVQLETFEADLRGADLARLREALGEPEFEACFRRGADLSFAEVLQVAQIRGLNAETP